MHIPFDVESLVQMHDQPFAIIDERKRILVVNQAYAETLGVTRQEVVGRSCYDRLCGHRRDCPCGEHGATCPFGKVFAGQSTGHYHRSAVDMEGRTHHLSIQAYSLHAGNGHVYVGELIQSDAARHHPAPDDPGPVQTDLVGSAPLFLEAKERLRRAGRSAAPILLLGDTGTGKELAAAYVHGQSRRRHKPFLTLDCTALTETLFESEVFGHERGAFTGSAGEKRGLFELADQGTLFLDEVGDMALPLQAKLLRVLESGQFRRVGSNHTRRADVRIICATNRELRGAPWFRSDLYYRIACVTVRLPSLVERLADIPALTRALLGRIARSSGQALHIDDDALVQLQGYDYPGNIRELRNILWVAAVNCEDGRITVQDIRDALPDSAAAPPSPEASAERPAPAVDPPQGVAQSQQARGQVAQEVAGDPVSELDHLARVLRRHQGNRRLAAQELGVSERTIYRKLRRFGLV